MKYIALLSIMCLHFARLAGMLHSNDSLLDNNHKLIKQINSELNLEQAARLNKQVAVNFQLLNKYDSAIVYYQKALLQAEESDLKSLRSSILYNLGLTYRFMANYELALEYADSALTEDESLADTTSITASLNLIALIYQDRGDYEKALDFRIKALDLSEKSNDELEIANSTYNLGNVYLKLGKQEKAMAYFSTSQEAFQQLLDNAPAEESLIRGLSETMYSLAGIHLANGNYEMALSEYSKSYELKTTISDQIGMGNCLQQMGIVRLNQKEYEAARQIFFRALGLKTMAGDRKGVAYVHYYIANLYYDQARYIEAQTFAIRSLSDAHNISDMELLRENYQLLYLIKNTQNNHREALTYHELYKVYADSVFNENTAKVVEELNVRYETDKKEKENQLLVQENEISSLTIQKQKAVGRYLIGLILLALVIVGILYNLFRSKKRSHDLIQQKNQQLGEQNTQIADQKKVIERKNRDLTDSIVYARRIQESMLTVVAKLNTLVDDAFVLFKPKDIVSGDFYWFGQKDGKIIISAIDCTGHGVPGAFMSMLGNTFLNQIVLNMGITSPKDILFVLSKEVQVALKQEETNNRDGMDMAICTIDTEQRTVTFAGAKNPLVFVQNGEVKRIKGDKAPIGLSYGENTKFTNHQVELTTNTCFYMFSDGYADQFGGPDNKKFMIKRFQNLLFENHNKPMPEQHKILASTMDEWMGDHEQIDDILVVGFKVNI